MAVALVLIMSWFALSKNSFLQHRDLAAAEALDGDPRWRLGGTEAEMCWYDRGRYLCRGGDLGGVLYGLSGEERGEWATGSWSWVNFTDTCVMF
jgi:hypothetical protein